MGRRVAALLLGISVAAGTAAAAQEQARVASTAALVEAGRKVYEREKCVTCHQIAGRGNRRFPLDGVASRLTADQLRRWMTDTERMENALARLPAVRMSAQKYRLTDAELNALVAFLQTLK